MDETLRSEVEAWIDDDPDGESRAELRALLEADDTAALRARFRGPLTFGTAGLRGLLGAGPHRINPAVVIKTTAGLCAHLRESAPDAASRGVCVGYDGRRRSRELAEIAASVIAGAGLRVRLFDDVSPTPLVGFAVLDQKAVAGIVITASHNPPEYNGYKVYSGNGAQIVPPEDAAIAAAIAAVPSVRGVTRATGAEMRARSVPLGAEIRARYEDAVLACALHPEHPRDLRIAYTALHGVGDPTVRACFRAAGFEEMHSVPEQATPDGSFPTVRFPNPEEDGAMDLVLALGEKEDADLVLANDPDADRLAVSVRHGGAFVPLSGNDIGCLLAHYLLEEGPGEGPPRLLVQSLVSSPLLLAIGEAHGVRTEVTLTGHKWIQNRALDLEAEGYRLVFGYEEALGYAVSSAVRDKDGISAALVIADMAQHCRTQGRTLIDERERMWRRYGMYLSAQVSRVFEGADGSDRIRSHMAAMRAEAPLRLGGRNVVAWRDYDAGVRVACEGSASEESAGVREPLPLRGSNVLLYELEGGHRAMLRPSGTEPKLKTYADVRVDVDPSEPLEDAEARGRGLLTAIATDLQRRLDRT